MPGIVIRKKVRSILEISELFIIYTGLFLSFFQQLNFCALKFSIIMSIRLQLRDIFNEDLDKLFDYTTPMLVLIKDRYLGLMAHLINLCILVYFIVYVIVIQKAYFVEEYSTGPSIVYASGTAISKQGSDVRVWDAVDVAYPQYDPSAIVIATKIIETTYQKRGKCTDYFHSCVSDTDCYLGGECVSGYCKEDSWCGNSTITHNLDGVENFIIWISGGISFITIKGGLKMTTMDETKAQVYPGSDSNSYLLTDILSKGGIKYSDIKNTGAVVRIRIDWNCDVTWHDSCSPTVESDRLDTISGTALGFKYDRFMYYSARHTQYRDYMNITGIKIFVESSGKAYAVTIQSIILNISSIINLTMLTPKIVDFLMVYVMKNRKEYKKNKYVISDPSKLQVKDEASDDDKKSRSNETENNEDTKDEHIVNRP